jgi:type IV secretion system protein TrbD
MLEVTQIRSTGEDGVLLMGCDRKLFFLFGTITAIFIFVGITKYLPMLLIGICFQAAVFYALRKLAKKDPFYSDVYLAERKYRKQYIEQSTPFCKARLFL